MSRAAPGVSSSTARTIARLAALSSTWISASGARSSPKSSGAISYSVTSPSKSSATCVGPPMLISSMPSAPLTTTTCSLPRRASTSASGRTQATSKTPSSWLFAPAGLVSGPSRLNTVRTPISRLGPIACFIAPWWRWANMKPMSSVSMQRAT